MIELFFALVAANRKGWGWYVILPLALDIFCAVSLIFFKTPAAGIYISGYFLALATLGWMCMVKKEKVLPGRKSKRHS